MFDRDDRDLGVRVKTPRPARRSQPATYVEVTVAYSVITAGVSNLRELREPMRNPGHVELQPMRMPRQDDIGSKRDTFVGELRHVVERQCKRMFFMFGMRERYIVVLRYGIVDADDPHREITMMENARFISQQIDIGSFEDADRESGVSPVIVISKHGERRAIETTEHIRAVFEVSFSVPDVVACQRDQVRSERVYVVDDLMDVLRFDPSAEMNIGYLRDRDRLALRHIGVAQMDLGEFDFR